MRAQGPQSFKGRDEDLLLEHVAACRDPERALGFLRKCLEKLGPSPVTPLRVERVTLVRDDWENCDAMRRPSDAEAR